MIVTVERYGLGRDSTLGRLLIDGEDRCFTLEDERREVKVPGETAIPEGQYRATLRTVGGFHGRYQGAFPDIHKGMIWLRDVPGFQYILMHCGNTDEDTAGCILVGSHPLVDEDGEFRIGQSRVAYRAVYPEIAAMIEAGDEVIFDVRTP